MKKLVFILSGGTGIRLRPLSTDVMPKQFLPIGINGKSFFRMTVDRALRITEKENIFVLTHEAYEDIVSLQAPSVPRENIICEPCRRNTAPAIAAAIMKISKKYSDAVVTVFPADHFISNEDRFCECVNNAVEKAEKYKAVVMMGLSPTRPDTAFGYIRSGEMLESGIYRTKCFVEKPDSNSAMDFLKDSAYFWNSGIFAVKIQVILEQYKKYLPEVYSLAEKLTVSNNKKENENLYSMMPNVSVDYGILEKTEDIVMVQGDFGWDDIGSWEALNRLGIDKKI